MHESQVDVRPGELRRLLTSQFPEWAELAIDRVPSSGTDNTIYRLGDELVVRLPLIDWAVRQVELEHEWLPKLAPLLPVELPTPVALGEPDLGYPWRWSVYRWIEGENPEPENAQDLDALAVDLANFVCALRCVDAGEVPRSSRGVPLRVGEEAIRGAIEQVRDQFDAAVLIAAWNDALAAPKWDGPWMPVHGDLTGGNLLVRDHRLHAVIDFSCFGLGDPANDVDVAWDLFSGSSRDRFRAQLDVDDATWRRARGWAIKAVYGIPYYEGTNPGIVGRARRRLDNVIADWRAEHA
jgi:aminoglycoside phosphotransferase (APT) family kinase protein